jgi:peptidoglycan hydrolase CwlO-like protein
MASYLHSLDGHFDTHIS